MMVAKLSISELLCKQRDFFQTGKTKPVDFRLQMLKNLKNNSGAQKSNFKSISSRFTQAGI